MEMSTAANAVSIKLPKFLVTTVEPKSQDGDKVVFDRYSKQTGELPLFLVDVKYEDKASVAAEWKEQSVPECTKYKQFVDAGKGDFSGTAVSQAEFTALLAKEGKELLFYLHGMGQFAHKVIETTDSLQTNFDSQKPEEVLVVPVEWACAEKEGLGGIPVIGQVLRYGDDQKNAEFAGSALWKLSTGLKKEMGSERTLSLNVMAHSMGNRVLRSVGKSSIPDGDASWNEKGLQGKTLLQAAPADLQNNENLFENIFFVSADIPESVFEEPTDGTESQQEEHALKSGVAALAVMSKRMHVLHANGWDQALNASSALNGGNARLGSRGPYASGESTKVWEAVSAEVEKKGGNVSDEENDKLFGNVHVQDCSEWNTDNDRAGHSYQSDPKSVAYYLEHM